jgi:hypothetical protein
MPSPTTSVITAEQSEAMEIGKFMAVMAAPWVGLFVLSVLICTDVLPRSTKVDKIFWGVVGVVSLCLLIAAVFVCLLLPEDSPCRRRHSSNKRHIC